MAAVDAVYRFESGRVLATPIRLLGDFDRAEEALHKAFRRHAVALAMRDGPGAGLGLIEARRAHGKRQPRRHAPRRGV